MSFVMIPEELLDVDLSAAQFRALIHIINNTYSTGKYAGCCCLGYRILADRCFTTKAAMINTVRQLEQLGFVEIDKREKFNRSNALRLTLEDGLKRCSSGMAVPDCSSFYGYEKDTDKGYENNTDKGYLKDTLGYLKDTDGYLKDTPHIDLKFKNQDLKNKNACARAEHGYLKDTDEEKKTAPAALSAGRFMPDKSSAGNERGGAAAAKSEDRILLGAMKARFTDIFDDLSVSRAENTYILRKKGRFALIEDVRLKEVADWMKSEGIDARILDVNTRVMGEVLIQEVA